MTDRPAAAENEPLQSANRRRLCRLLLGGALVLPSLAVAGCAGNPRPDWEPDWQRGKRGGGSHNGRGTTR